MKLVKVIGLISLICFTFFYTEKIMDVSIMQDDIMIEIMENKDKFYVEAIDGIINDDTIIPGNNGSEVDLEKSYSQMKKIGFYEETLIVLKEKYPMVSIYDNYDKYVISGNVYNKKVALIYILNTDSTFNNLLVNKDTKINLFVDRTFLINNMKIINKSSNFEFYNYGDMGKYTKDGLIIGNNIINNKAKNQGIYCLFIEKDSNGLNVCKNSRLLSIMPTIKGGYQEVKNKLSNGSIILINNTGELSSIIRYINSKGYEIVGLSEIIKE